MNQKIYANDRLLEMACLSRKMRSVFTGIVKMSDTENLRAALTELSSLGRMLVDELHARGKSYSDV